MRDSIADDLTKATEIAKGIAVFHMPEIYGVNYDYGTYQVERVARVDTSYTLFDRLTAQRMFLNDNEFYHKHGWRVGLHIEEGKVKKWEKKQVQSVMLQSLLQGESVGKIATRLHNATGDSIIKEDIKGWRNMTAEEISKELVRRNRNASIRNARTMATGVQNAGRTDSYKRAEGMGIKLMQEWLATLDNRTRHEHRQLDGQRVAVGEKFQIDGYELEYPADPQGAPHLIYNCRCTLVPALKGFEVDSKDLSLRNTNHMQEETYEEWKEGHGISEPITKQDEIEQTMKRKYGAEYKRYEALNTRVTNDKITSDKGYSPKGRYRFKTGGKDSRDYAWEKSQYASHFPTIPVPNYVNSALMEYVPYRAEVGTIFSKEVGSKRYTFEYMGHKEVRVIAVEDIPDAVTELFKRDSYKK